MNDGHRPGATRCGVSPGGDRCRGPPTPAGRHDNATCDRLGVLEVLVALATLIGPDALAEGYRSQSSWPAPQAAATGKATGSPPRCRPTASPTG